jgi:hypothetical protein
MIFPAITHPDGVYNLRALLPWEKAIGIQALLESEDKGQSYRRSSETSYDLHLHISAKSAIVLDKNAEIRERRKIRDKR